jgi:two-component system sensor histidine kinase/response regulator
MVLMDVQMPVLDGLAATRQIRRQLGMKLPIVAMSAGVLLAERDTCIEAGMNDFLGKPFNASEMLATIQRFVTVPQAVEQAVAPSPGMAPGIFDVSVLASLNERFPERRGQLYQLIAKVLDSAGAEMAEARRLHGQGQGEAAGRLLHTLRGSVGTLGAKRFVAASLALEAALTDQDGAGVDALFDDAGAQLRQTIEQGQRWLAALAASA